MIVGDPEDTDPEFNLVFHDRQYIIGDGNYINLE